MKSQSVRVLLLIAASWSMALGAGKPKPTSQSDIQKECVFVRDIHSTGKYGGQRVNGVVFNSCTSTVNVYLTIGYFDNRDEQYGDEIEFMSVAASTTRRFYHDAPDTGLMGPRWKFGRIIAVQVNPIR